MAATERRLRYLWREDIWAVHLEVENRGEADGTLRIDYGGTSHFEVYTVTPGETMRYNVARHGSSNTHVLVTVPALLDVKLFENLDRAFYTDSAVELEDVEETPS